MKRLNWLLIVSCLVAVSCSKDEDSEISPFAGKWSGEYLGPDRGTWIVTIDEDGELSGTGSSTLRTLVFELSGSVSTDGSFLATIGSTTSGGEFTGTLTMDGKASGTWKNTATTPVLEGTWSGERE